MKKCIKVFLISFIAAFPLAGLVRATYMTKTTTAEVVSPHNSISRMAEEQMPKESIPVSTSHDYQETAGR